MIIPDINLVLYAYDEQAQHHDAARQWWERLLNGADTVGLPWAVILGFIRIATNPKVYANPLDVSGACRRVRTWLERPQVVLIHPGQRHGEIFFALLERVGSAGNLTTDAHLAALAIEHQAELHSADSDMVRFPGLKWINPIANYRAVHRSAT